jgi:lycopene beta-cyclase
MEDTSPDSRNLSGASGAGNRYDFIMAGAGCAGLSLAMHLVASGKFRDKEILLADRDAKLSNDRTWCFWEKDQGVFEPVVFRQWQQLSFHSPGFSSPLSIAPYHYKMIRGIDFYEYCRKQMEAEPNVHFLKGNIEELRGGQEPGIKVNGTWYEAGFVFNSILLEKPVLRKKEWWLLQHFKGWVIETPEAVFDPSAATLMDFRIEQKQGTAFCYVLPFSTRQALVEYTLFTPALLKPEDYDEGLRSYIGKQLGIQDYKVLDEEFGVIPMTNYAFPKNDGCLIYIGTAGGQTKGSSGYTFQFIQKHSRALVRQLEKRGHPFLPRTSSRHAFYDSVLLNILQHHSLPGSEIFTDLFKKNKASSVLRFLDNESSLPGELRIISTLPTWPFFKAAIRQLGV